MANEIRIDLADPVLAEALAGCEPGETHTITMDIAVSEKTAELLGTVTKGPAAQCLGRIEQQMPSIEERYRKEIKQTERDGYHRRKIDQTDYADAGNFRGHNGYTDWTR